MQGRGGRGWGSGVGRCERAFFLKIGFYFYSGKGGNSDIDLFLFLLAFVFFSLVRFMRSAAFMVWV